jgi:hypothetical protein
MAANKCNVTKEGFIRVFISNELADAPLSHAKLGATIDVSPVMFCYYLKKWRDAIDARMEDVCRCVYRDAVRALRRKLKAGDVQDTTIQMALRFGPSGASGTTVPQGDGINIPAGTGGIVVVLPPLAPSPTGNGNGHDDGGGAQ